jgi:IclR family transcriptional regulator, KDG regulon repressor
MPKVSGEAVEGVQSVVLALRTLEYLARARNFVGVTELAAALDTTKTRVHRHLGTLVQQGYVTHAPESGRYHVGTRLITLGRLVAESTDLSLAAQPHMRALRETLGQTCVLSQFEQDGARIVLAMSGRSPIEIGVKPGSLLPFHNSAQGKVMLAYATPEFRERILSEPMPATTPHTITAPEALEADLAAIRLRGWAVAPNQSALGLNALATPLFDESSAIVGALAIVDLEQFIPAQPRDDQLDALVKAAAGISGSLGYRGR